MKNQPAIIITQKESKEMMGTLGKLLMEFRKKYNPKIVKECSILWRFLDYATYSEFSLIIINNIFVNYRDYDTFLIYLLQNCGFHSVEENGLLLGHFDTEGFFWSDYQSFYKIEENVLK